MRWVRGSTAPWRVALILGGLLLVAIGGSVLAGHVPAVREGVRRWAENQLTRRLGREVRAADADVRLLQGRLELRHLRVASGLTLADGTLLTVDSVRTTWSWRALLHRSWLFDRILLVQPRLNLRPTDASATPSTSWLSFLLHTEPATPEDWRLVIGRVEIEAGHVAWETKSMPGTLDGVQATLEWRPGAGASLAATLHASRLAARVGDIVREVSHLTLKAEGNAEALTIAAVEGVVAGARITGKGRILDPAGAGDLDLALALSAPLEALLKSAGVPREVEGLLTAEGRLRGPWTHATFQGRGDLRLPKTSRAPGTIAFALRWTNGRFEVETPPADLPDSFGAKLALEPATGAYRARFKVRETELGELTGVPALAAQFLGLVLPAELGGRLTANIDLSGRGADLTTLRGRGSVRVDDLSVEAGLPTGHLEARVVATASHLALQTLSLDVPGGTVRGNGYVTFADGRLDLPIQADIRSMAALGRGFSIPLLGGNAKLSGRLAGTHDAPRFQGHVTWRELRIAQYAVDHIEGDIDWSPRTLRSPRLVVQVGGTTATLHGGVFATGQSPLRRLNLRRDLVLDLSGQVNPGRSDDVAQFLPPDLNVQGAFRANGRIAGTPEAPTGEVDIALTNVRTWSEQWRRGGALVRLTPDGTEITRLMLRRGREQVRGDIRVGNGRTLSGHLTGTAIDLGRLGILAESRIAGRADLQVDLSGTVSEPRAAGRGSSDALKLREVPMGPADATFALDTQTTDVDLALRDGSHRLQLHVGPPPDRSLRLDLALTDADLDLLLRVASIEGLRPFQARGTGRLVLRGPAGDLATSVGDATFSSLRLRYTGNTWESQGPVELSWQGRTTTLRRLRLASGEWRADLQGILGDGDQSSLRVKARLPFVGLPGLPSAVQPLAGTVTADLNLRGTSPAPEVRGRLEIGGGRFLLAGIAAPFEDVESVLDIERARTIIRSFQGRLAGGNISGNGDVSHGEPAWSLRLNFQEDGGRGEELLGLPERSITGALTLGGSLASRGPAQADFWRNLDGQLRVTMRDGHIGRQTLVARLLTLLDLGHLPDPNGSDLFSEGMPYQRVTGDITVEGGVARTENFVVDTRAAKMSAVGRANLVDETVELDVAIKPLQTLDSLLGRIPLAGWILGGKEKGLIVAYYKVTGPIRDPVVTPRPLTSVDRNVFGLFRRLLEIPEAITGPFEDLPPQPPKPEPGNGR